MECELVTSYAPKNGQKLKFICLPYPLYLDIGDACWWRNSVANMTVAAPWFSDAHYHSKLNTIKYYFIFFKK